MVQDFSHQQYQSVGIAIWIAGLLIKLVFYNIIRTSVNGLIICATGVTTPISGVLTLLKTGRGHFVEVMFGMGFGMW